ncbi:MAG: hypothetical protein CM1200mP15_10200 [Dehalococcoidia bacterium]|nr:MAG: hypothetical protein CM1200mP15_10200 [Dehalococcoidia bacterium]
MSQGASDTASFDNALELLLMTGRSLSHSMLMMIPEAWEQHESMPTRQKGFLRIPLMPHGAMGRASNDGSATGNEICAVLDRNGLRPFR